LNDALRDQLLVRAAADQEMRQRFQDASIDPEAQRVLAERTLATDADNSRWLKQVVAVHGWPGRGLVGPEGAEAAYLLAQHAPDPSFQRRCLALLEQAVAAGEAEPVQLAHLTDRVRVGAGQPQLFGTQGCPRPFGSTDPIVPAPVDDETLVDQRRAALGLPSMQEHFRRLNAARR
jgi:hypothetical protein